MKDLERIWARTDLGRREDLRVHLCMVKAERDREERVKKAPPVARPAATFADLFGGSNRLMSR